MKMSNQTSVKILFQILREEPQYHLIEFFLLFCLQGMAAAGITTRKASGINYCTCEYIKQ